jgi:hypothetical protein
VADASPNLFWVMTIGMANDVPADIADRVIAKQALFCCGKPLVFCCRSIGTAMMILLPRGVLAPAQAVRPRNRGEDAIGIKLSQRPPVE